MPDCGPSFAPGWVPNWVFCPRDRILEVVTEWIIGWIVSGAEAVALAFADAVAAVFDSLGLAGSSAGTAFVSSAEVVGSTLFGVAFSVNNAILDVAASSGPVATVVVVVLYGGVGLAFVASLVVLRKGCCG